MDELMKPVVYLTALDFSRAEMEAIHKVCDDLEVPAFHDDQPLSASQRVVALAEAYKAACGRIGRGT